MRFYTIKITNQDSGAASLPTFTSLTPIGTNDPGALNIEMDVTVTYFHTPSGDNGSFLRIWGVPLYYIAQTKQLWNNRIQLFAGMSKGLPLANPAQAGLIFDGAIWQAFGNWIGTSQTLDLIVYPNAGSQTTPLNFAFQWKAGTSLVSAITQTIKTALPSMTVSGTISNKLVLNHDDVGYFPTMAAFAQHINEITQPIPNDPTYQGVKMVIQQNKVILSDGTSQTTPKKINFYDMVGQPTWREFQVIQVSLVMRGDLSVGDYIQLPPSPVITSPQSFPQFRQQSIFQGVFVIQNIRYVGNFRQRDGRAWMTVVDAYGPIPQTNSSSA